MRAFLVLIILASIISCDSAKSLNGKGSFNGVDYLVSDTLCWVRYSDESLSSASHAQRMSTNTSQEFNLFPNGLLNGINGIKFQ